MRRLFFICVALPLSVSAFASQPVKQLGADQSLAVSRSHTAMSLANAASEKLPAMTADWGTDWRATRYSSRIPEATADKPSLTAASRYGWRGHPTGK
jgi:hypothetical protein